VASKSSSELASAAARLGIPPDFAAFADSRTLRHLLRTFAPAPLGGQFRGAHTDLAEMLFVRRHRRDGGALGGLQLATNGVETIVAQLTKRVGLDLVAERGKLHPGHSTRSPAAHRGACASICCMTHAAIIENEGGTARGSGSSRRRPLRARGRVVTLTIDHPPANAVNGDVVTASPRGSPVSRPTSPAVRWSSRGNGPKFFSAGADISGFGAGADAIGKATDLTLLFEASRLPVIAAVNGIAFGGWLRAHACMRRPYRGAYRALRPAGDQARHHPRLGRHPAPAAADRHGARGRAAAHR